MIKKVVAILAIILFVILVFPLFASEEQYDEMYRKYRGVGVESLNAEADSLYQAGAFDKAIMVFEMITRLPVKDKDLTTQMSIARAYNMLGLIYFFEYSDVAKSYEYFTKALEQCDKYGLDSFKAPIYLNFGNVFSVCEDIPNSQTYFKKAFYESLKNNDTKNVAIAFVNMFSTATDVGDLEDYRQELEAMGDYEIPQDYSLREYLLEYQKALQAIYDKDYPTALSSYDRMEGLVDPTLVPERFTAISLLGRGHIYDQTGDIDSAISETLSADSLSLTAKMPDARIEIQKFLSGLYNKKGDQARALEAKQTYLDIQENFLNNKKINKIHEIKLTYDVNRFNEYVTHMEKERRIQTIFLTMTLIVVAVIIIFLLVIFRKNRQLRRNNQDLYSRIMDSLRQEEDERHRRQLLQQRLDESRKEVELLKQTQQSQQSQQSNSHSATVFASQQATKPTLSLKDTSASSSAEDTTKTSSPSYSSSSSTSTSPSLSNVVSNEAGERKDVTDSAYSVDPATQNVSVAAYNSPMQKGTGAKERVSANTNASVVETDYGDLKNRILEAFETNEEVYRPNFSLGRLAEITAIKTKNLSQLINEAFGKNFYTLLAEYRVREACRRMANPEFIQNYTIETIAMELGFKSRPNFVSVFKKLTGLSPSQFCKNVQLGQTSVNVIDSSDQL